MPQYAELGLPLLHAGKVRELYELDERRALMVATDNISAYDVVLSPRILGKGIVLTQLSIWWFEQLSGIVGNHMLSTQVPALVAGRALEVERLDMVPIEAVVRGYLTGSGWAEYQQTRSVTGITLPEGLHDGSRLPEPVFTPARKAVVGAHDENITYREMVEMVGDRLAESIRDLSLALYHRAEQITRERGIILADTKFEFGVRPTDGTVILGDEVLTPDSSRFWDIADWEQGRLHSYDKQYLRDWLVNDSGWDRSSDAPPPPLPAEIVEVTRARYAEAFRTLTGTDLEGKIGS